MARTQTQKPQSQHKPQDPTSLLEAVRYFSDPDVALDFVRRFRWEDGEPYCPHCGCYELSFLTTRRIWKCRNPQCRRQFSAKVGTIFEDSPLGWDKWLPAMWLLANSKNSVSSHELARALRVTQKTAWFMFHRIRDAMATGTFDKLDGEVEADETYVGGKLGNMHRRVREAKGYGKGAGMASDKTAVAGLVERGGRVRAFPVASTDYVTMEDNVIRNVAIGADLFTDQASHYQRLDQFYAHKTVDHGREYVRGIAHINTMENFWSLLKRALKGTQVHVAPKHLHRYVTERTFAYNYRDRTDNARMRFALSGAAGKRLTYAQLTGKN